MAVLLRRALMCVLVLLASLLASGGTPDTLEYRLHREIATPTFTVAGFVLSELPRVLPLSTAAQAAPAVDPVRTYLASAQRAADLRQAPRDGQRAATTQRAAAAEAQAKRRALEPLATQTIASQVAAVLRAEGLGLGGGDVFPPVRFVFREPPLMLVVSPREQIALRTAVPLESGLDDDAREGVEARAERLGVSALVVEIGGLATYPAMLPPAGDLPWLLESVAHEWSHNYFTLRPLGWRYALGLERDAAVITINETAADLIGREVGRRALREFYGEKVPEPGGPVAPDARAAHFRARMRAIRAEADRLLAAGEVDAAERQMEAERQALEREGIKLRKLNQAYFAFHGSYADGPAGRLDPVVAGVKRLRAESTSLRAFAERVSGVSSAEALRALTRR